jgi:hypothetical protein
MSIISYGCSGTKSKHKKNVNRNVENTYFNNEKCIRNKRLSISPNYGNTYKVDLDVGHKNQMANNVTYFTTKKQGNAVYDFQSKIEK